MIGMSPNLPKEIDINRWFDKVGDSLTLFNVYNNDRFRRWKERIFSGIKLTQNAPNCRRPIYNSRAR